MQLTEWRLRTPTGFVQAFTIASGASADDIRLEIRTAATARMGGPLDAWDATGRAVGAKVEATDPLLSIQVAADQAVFPITIQPAPQVRR